MERAIVKTLVYADIFDYPLKAWEIHKWLISKKGCSLPDVEKGLKRLVRRGEVVEKDGYYALNGRKGLVKKRLDKVESSRNFLQEARTICRIFKLVPWIKLVGISGNLAMENAGVSDDIDLFVITAKKRLWLSRIVILSVLTLLEKRRKKDDDEKKAAGKFCLNLLIEEDQLEQERKDLYTAHEVLQMLPLWERGESYGKFLEANDWVFNYLANWVSGTGQGLSVKKQKKKQLSYQSNIVSFCEAVVRFLQLRYMGVERKGERVSEVAVYFHPEDNQPRVLREYEKRVKKYLGK